MWDELGIEATGDTRAIKRAYATRLKIVRSDEDPDAFQALRNAYEAALLSAESGQWDDDADEAPEQESRHSRPAPRKAVHDETATAEQDVPVRVVMHPAPRSIDYEEATLPPERVAQTLWDAFLHDDAASDRIRLNRLEREEALHNFEVKDAFEMLAVRYCADAGCGEDRRVTLVLHFRWHEDSSHVHQLDAAATAETLSRYYAERSHAYLMGRRMEEPAIAFLLADKPPAFSMRRFDRRFFKAMRDLLQEVHWNHQAFVRHRLNPEVAVWWDEWVAGKRYFYQTAFGSFIVGNALFLLYLMAAEALELPSPHNREGLVMLVSQVLAWGGFALYAFCPPLTSIGAVSRFKDGYYDPFMHVSRDTNAWQFYWRIAYVPASLAIFLPIAGPLENFLVLPALAICAVLAFVTATADMTKVGATTTIVCSALFAAGMFLGAFSHLHFMTVLFFCVPMCCIAFQGGQRAFEASKITADSLSRIRIVWLVGVLVLFVVLANNAMTPILAWLACLSGLMISRTIWDGEGSMFTFLVAGLVAAININHYGDTPSLGFLIAILTATTITVARNLHSGITKNVHFS